MVDMQAIICEGKKRFPTRAAAKKKARLIYRKYGPALYVYQCPNCKGFHLTKNKQDK
jgi:hypothetical protein